MTQMVEPAEVKQWLSDGSEIAFIDVREHGPYGDGHPFFGIPVAYSVFETRLTDIVPNRAVRMVLYDNAEGLAELAAARANALGYSNVSIMKGGAPAWGAAGFTLYEGVNLPSKTFGELLEIERHTPRKSPEDVVALAKEKANHVIVDGRPWAEFTKFNIPGGICCPNGELALRIKEIAPDPETTIIVNCAGRTRSILGAQTLIDIGVPNPVYALENGTQGWFLAGLDREEGADRSYPDGPKSPGELEALRARSKERAAATGVPYATAEQAGAWLADSSRTTYLFDVRTHEEFEADGVPGSRHAPGGQLVQATDQWVGVRGARLIVMDNDMIRAPMVANWLHQLGHEVYILEDGVEAARRLTIPMLAPFEPEPLPAMSPVNLAAQLDHHQLVDLRTAMTYRANHIDGAQWSIRPRFDRLALEPGRPVVLISDSKASAALAAQRLVELGHSDVRQLQGDAAAWRAAGLKMVATPNDPPDSDCIDFLFHTHQRNDGDEAAARAYIAWEIGLVDQ
ncbi:MAG: rhodanese-like domain-containing protein, partial [Hyphomicrobiaceae bacterium]